MSHALFVYSCDFPGQKAGLIQNTVLLLTFFWGRVYNGHMFSRTVYRLLTQQYRFHSGFNVTVFEVSLASVSKHSVNTLVHCLEFQFGWRKLCLCTLLILCSSKRNFCISSVFIPEQLNWLYLFWNWCTSSSCFKQFLFLRSDTQIIKKYLWHWVYISVCIYRFVTSIIILLCNAGWKPSCS
jgi:hypothetical protein